MGKYDKCRTVVGLTTDNLPKSIPLSVRECYIETIKRLTYNETDELKIQKNIIRIGHMINSAFIAEDICRHTHDISMSNSIVAITSALFHDIIKLNDIGVIKWDILYMDEQSQIKIVKDMDLTAHAELSASILNIIFSLNPGLELTCLEKNKIIKAIQYHSDKFDTGHHVKSIVEKIVIESDILEKMGLSSIFKKINKLDNQVSSVLFELIEKKSEFESFKEVFKTPFAITLYNERLDMFDNIATSNNTRSYY